MLFFQCSPRLIYIFCYLWEVGNVRASIPDIIDVTDETNSGFLHILRNLYKSIILTVLDFALDKKVEQDLWSVCFKVHISGLQSKSDRKNVFLNWFMKVVSGFYLSCFRKSVPNATMIQLSAREISSWGFTTLPPSVKPKNESFLYICQHCLIHLSDLSRFRNLMGEADGYYKQAIRVEPSSCHPYNQLALLEIVRAIICLQR